MTQPKTPPSELVHYGVKGMHWGVRKNTPNPGYSQNQRIQDRKTLGRGGVRKINRRLNKGESYQSARQKVLRNRAMVKLAVAGGVFAAPEILRVAEMTSGSIAQRAQTKRGQAAVADLMGLPRMATTGPAYAKKSRGGIHKITSR